MRLIDAEALCAYANNQKEKTIDANDIMRFPIVDAVPVIRCKDCKFFDRLTSELTFCIRGGTEEEPNAMVMTENDYCSRGKRKEKESGITERQDSNP